MAKRAMRGAEVRDDLTPEQVEEFDRLVEEAEGDVEAMRAQGRWGPSEGSVPVESPSEARVNIRWPRTQLEIIQRAAELFGMPYQTYVKQAAFRAALDDLVKVKAAVQDRQKPPATAQQASKEEAA